MDALSFRQVQCPYCGEWINLQIDASGGEQACVEDCSVCCRPIEVQLLGGGEDWSVEVRRDDE